LKRVDLSLDAVFRYSGEVMDTSGGTAPAPVIIKHDGVLVVGDDLFRGGTKARGARLMPFGADVPEAINAIAAES
jgi:hypothetical protein